MNYTEKEVRELLDNNTKFVQRIEQSMRSIYELSARLEGQRQGMLYGALLVGLLALGVILRVLLWARKRGRA